VTLHGMNFEAGALVIETDPDGLVTQIITPQIISTAPTTLRFTRAFPKLGLYTFVVVNPGGEQSNPVTMSAT
jgi:hypothetical protein